MTSYSRVPSTTLLLTTFGLFIVTPSVATAADPMHFQRHVLSERFYSEGADVGDIDGDGTNDIVSGPFYYRGPEFGERVRYRSGEPYAIAGYSDQFFTFVDDIDEDGDQDIITVPIPGIAAHWFENPGTSNANDASQQSWQKHLVIDKVDGESPDWLDVDGDGRRELVCIYGGSLGYARPTEDPRQPWSFVRISPNRNYGRFTHGLGIGDVDGDGHQDFLETNGWWRQPDNYQPGDLFEFQACRFAQSGGAQMFAIDVDGDGDNDVVSSQNAHGFGLGWFEQMVNGGERQFKFHEIMGSDPAQGLAISQLHAVAIADVDRDGRPDVITGKRFWAHGGHDPDATNDPAIYWFRNRLVEGAVRFEPHLIVARAGVGTQLVVEDIDGDGDIDIVVGNKLGTFVMTQNPGERQLDSERPGVAPGSAAFASPVRPTEPLSPQDERRTFRLPAGFEVQLVAAEPDIAKPLNLAFDVRGRLWATTSLEYPYAAPADRQPRDSIKVFEDTNGDGSFDKVLTFADGLNVPIGLYPYGDGVICFSIPHIWYLRDTNGDGKADKREELYGPMGYERDTHGLCNAFRRGFDGWLYACHGFNNHTTVKGRDGHEITMQSGNTFRMRLDGQRIEQYTWGQVNPFGMMIDDRGDILTADCHTKPVTLLIPKGHYESFGKPHDGLGFVPAVMNHLHGSTAIAGITPVDPRHTPADYAGTTLGGNVMTSRINRNSLVYSGSTIQAREEPDFLVAGDPWFRPVDVRLGPDGAIYVADFYNKIIGHYEVPLDHPGRDRHRGRIWRISYRRGDKSTPASLSSSRIDRMSPEQLFDAAATANSTRQSMIINYLCDAHAGAETNRLARARLLAADEPEAARVAALWVLARGDNGLTSLPFERVLENASPLLRGHVMHVVRHTGDALGDVGGELVASGLADDEALVRRYAAQAASFVSATPLDKMLLSYQQPSDPHLKHSLKIAIRERLKEKAAFERIVAQKNPLNDAALIDVALALEHDAASDYIIRVLPGKIVGWNEEQRQAYIRHAASRAGVESMSELATVVKASMNLRQQRELLLVIRDGLAERGSQPPAAVQQWAEDIASDLLIRGADTVRPLAWKYSAFPGTPDRGNPFVKQTRRAADNVDADYFCTLPSGEQRTGIYRSAPFEVGETLSFFTAGHIGPPNKPLVPKNFIRLRDAESHQILHEATPPRNDTAQRIEWNTADHDGRVYVEIEDGDTRRAYAWLAVGRFSVMRLNPSSALEERRQAAELFGAFRLEKLKADFEGLLKTAAGNSATDRAILIALGKVAGSTRMSACGEALSLPSPNARFRELIIDATFEGDEAMEKALETAMLSATALAQTRVAKQLVADQVGCELLLNMIEKGKASATLLLDPAVLERLKVVDGGRLKERVEVAASSVQAQAALEKQQHIETRLQAYLAAPGNPTKGLAIFKKQCSQCHQAAGDGAKIAPQLDGIRSRGVARLVEDIVAPNRNVDVAFRTTTIATTGGQVINGVIRSEDKDRMVVVDQEGKEQVIAIADIDERVPSRSSLMPANVMELVKGNDWNDLMAYLLSLK